MAKRIVIALGGNALGKNLEEQMQAVKTTASAIASQNHFRLSFMQPESHCSCCIVKTL